MINVVEALTELVKNFTDEEPKPPLHVGEVMALWTAFTAFEEAHSLYQIGLNTTNDPDLITLLEDALKGSNQDSIKIQDLLVKEGVPLPLSNANKPESNPMSVPNGVRLTDDEIAKLNLCESSSLYLLLRSIHVAVYSIRCWSLIHFHSN
ncbi:DUF3231 family protein [Bacillus coahuilensis]|uniref:DUF3231 family protein n=1 Tax=Bacillus coahuilensis TaxID=408580 RepID=UPI000A9F7A65|nr:DUF3231 family protein [Bacillus coahuilensis]